MTTKNQISFEVEAGKVLPKFARQRGQPYTGFATASDLIVDWSGYFLDGLPHGKFFICWGDRVSGHYFFEHGVEVTQP
jgi:hypothetical protein